MQTATTKQNDQTLYHHRLSQACGEYVRIRNHFTKEERLVLPMSVAFQNGALFIGVRFGMNPQLYWFNMSSKWELVGNESRQAA